MHLRLHQSICNYKWHFLLKNVNVSDWRGMHDEVYVHWERTLTYLPHFTSEYMTIKSPSWRPFALTKSPELMNICPMSSSYWYQIINWNSQLSKPKEKKTEREEEQRQQWTTLTCVLEEIHPALIVWPKSETPHPHRGKKRALMISLII